MRSPTTQHYPIQDGHPQDDHPQDDHLHDDHLHDDQSRPRREGGERRGPHGHRTHRHERNPQMPATDPGPEYDGDQRRRGRGRSRQDPTGGRRGGFGGGPRRPHRARRGDIRAAILSLLGQQPHNGYGLMKSFDHATDGAWRPSPGSIYPTLTQLQDEGLIVASGEGRSSEFALTDAGRAYIVEHADELDRAWQAATGQSEEDLAFHESVAKLHGAIEQFRIAASDEQRAAGGKAIDDARRALYLILAE